MRTPRSNTLLITFIFFACIFCSVISIRPGQKKNNRLPEEIQAIKRTIHFEPNVGQVPDDFEYISNGNGYSLLLRGDEAIISFHEELNNTEEINRSVYIKMQLAGACRHPEVREIKRLKGNTNYFIGNDPDQWKTNIPTFGKVRYENVYPGIDLVYYGNEGLLEYDFIVAPEGDPEQIMLQFESNRRPTLDEPGNLVFRNGNEKVVMRAPVAYQEIEGERKHVKARFALNDDQVTFKLGKYDPRIPLIIDPKIIFSTYFAVEAAARAENIVVDHEGSIYLTGRISAFVFPVTDSNLLPTTFRTPIFVTKMSSDSKEILYSTYFGGDNEDIPWSLDIDTEGNIFIAGRTHSKTFPLKNAVDEKFGGDIVEIYGDGEGFLTKINPEGDEMVFSTFLGGRYDDEIHDMVVDQYGNAIVTGLTNSEDFPVKNAIQPTTTTIAGYDEAIVAKFSPTGSIIFSTYFGGDFDDMGYAVDIDADGNIYFAGNAAKTFPDISSVSKFDESSSYVVKLNSSGSSVAYIKKLGFIFKDEHATMKVDDIGNVYLAGSSMADNLTTVNAFQTNIGGFYDGFIVKLLSDGSTIDFASYLGGSNYDRIIDMDIDNSGNMYVFGYTQSDNFPTAEPFQSTLKGKTDAFVAMIDGASYDLAFSTYLGGSDWEGGIESNIGINVGPNGYVYLAGHTHSDDFPVENAREPTTSKQGTAYIVKLTINERGKLEVTPDPIVFPTTEPGQTSEEFVELSNTGIGPLEIRKIRVEPSSVYSLSNLPTLPYSLDPDEDVEIKIVYSPAALKGTNQADASAEEYLEVETDAEVPVKRVSLFSGIIINDSSDASDADLTDNICDIDKTKKGLQVTLRAALEHINAMKRKDVTYVKFDIPGWNVPVIRPKKLLPVIEYPVTLDASTQLQGYVVLDGSGSNQMLSGLIINAGKCNIKNMNFMLFKGCGIELVKAGGNTIDNCVITYNCEQSPQFNAGINIENSPDNTVKNSVISGNFGYGIWIQGIKASDNMIINNKVGIRSNSIEALGNGYDGIRISRFANRNTISENTISGNTGHGISIWYSESDKWSDYEETGPVWGNGVLKNTIGLNGHGKSSIPNQKNGILISGTGAKENNILENVIAGNNEDGIRIQYGSRQNKITENQIGIEISASVRIGNGRHGISIEFADDNHVEINTIINNDGNGINIIDDKPGSNKIASNYIGRIKGNNDPESYLGNLLNGIYVRGASPFLTDNSIANHSGAGILIVDGGSNMQYNNIFQNDFGIRVKRSSNSLVTNRTIAIYKNNIYDNHTGIYIKGEVIRKGDYTIRMHVNGNFIFENIAENTGMYINNIDAEIRGNWFWSNKGNALTVEGNRDVTLRLNNLTENSEYGLENRSASVSVDAVANYWGDLSGPGGNGPGTGDKVSSGVDYSQWKTELISVYAAAELDTFPAAIGHSDSVMLVFDNWSRFSDTLVVNISDDLGWIEANSPRMVRTPYYSDDVATLFFTVPDNATNGIFNQVQMIATSWNDPTDSMVTEFYIHAQKPEIKYLELYPDTIAVAPQSTLQFSTIGYDQFHHRTNPDPDWSCTGGTIDENGMYTAGSENGTFLVSAYDPGSGLISSAQVIISDELIILDENQIILSDLKQLHFNYPNPFTTGTTIRYKLDEPAYVELKIYNSIGQEIIVLKNGIMEAGIHENTWKPSGLAGGVYFSRLEVKSKTNKSKEGYSEIRKMIYLK